MNPNRSTTKETIHAIENTIARGGTDQWKELYQKAKADPSVRENIKKVLPRLDREISPGAAILWEKILE